jgi:hypothetical protein
VFASFDLDSVCCALVAGARFYACTRFAWAIRYGVNLLEPRYNRTNFATRALKYMSRGFRVADPAIGDQATPIIYPSGRRIPIPKQHRTGFAWLWCRIGVQVFLKTMVNDDTDYKFPRLPLSALSDFDQVQIFKHLRSHMNDWIIGYGDDLAATWYLKPDDWQAFHAIHRENGGEEDEY